MATDRPSWVIVKVFTQGSALAEVSRAGDTGKFAYRLSWTDGARQGPWYPDLGISHLECIVSVAKQAEEHCLAERDKFLAEQAARLDNRRQAEGGRRRSHDEALAKVSKGRRGKA